VPRRALVLAFVTLALAGCGDDVGPGADVDTGVTGVVLAGPQCPVVQEGSPCPDLPVPDVEVRALRDGSVAGTGRTNAEGRFEILLDPGDYVLEAVVGEGGGPPFAEQVDVTVPSGGVVEVTVPVDTGIR
jgi:hypothetical protein